MTLGKPEPPLNVVVTARGELDLDRRLFRSGEGPVHMSPLATVLDAWMIARCRHRFARGRGGHGCPLGTGSPRCAGTCPAGRTDAWSKPDRT